MNASLNPTPLISEKALAKVSELYQEFTHFDGFVMTKKGSLIGCVRLKGLDTDGLKKDDFIALSMIARSFYTHLSPDITTTQYFAHFDGAEITFKDRENPVSHMLSKRRQLFLSKEKISSTDLVHFFEIDPPERLNNLKVTDMIKHFSMYFFNAESREILKRHFSKSQSIIAYVEDLEKQAATLRDTLNDVVSRWEGIFTPEIMTLDQNWAFMKFVANLDPYYLSQNFTANIPDTRLDLSLADGDRDLVTHRNGNIDLMKLGSSIPNYVRVLSVNNFKGKSIPAGLWSESKTSPTKQTGNYLIMSRFKPLSRFQKATLFRNKQAELNRRNYDLMAMISNKQQATTEAERRELMKPAIRKALEDLGEAEMIDDLWGMAEASITIWSADIKVIRNQSVNIKRAVDRANMDSCWESAGLSRAYRAMQVAGSVFNSRKIPFTATQYASSSLLYSPMEGQKTVPDLNNDEAQYVFIAEDGSPFYYSPFVKEKAVVIGVGPIRSGKTFTKNTVASHFVKYGGFLQAIDIDQGMEPVAMSFGDDGGVFRTSEDSDYGFNPFTSLDLELGVNDDLFRNHLKGLMMQMIRANDTDDLRMINGDEQESLDRAIITVIRMPPENHRLQDVVQHCIPSLRKKLARWVYKYQDGADGPQVSKESGMYAKFFDSQIDAIGAIDKKIMANNLRSVKDNETVLPLIMSEIFFRTTRKFEDVNLTHVPKYLDIDEAHNMLKNKHDVDYLVRYVRTSGKSKAGIGLWTQNPLEFANLPDWSAIRSAASTFFFMADQNMDVDLYKEAFLLSDGECEAIKNLRPKKEAFIIQRDLGVAKKVIVKVENEQLVISTSTGSQTQIRRENIDKYGFEEGMRRTLLDFGLRPTSEEINH